MFALVSLVLGLCAWAIPLVTINRHAKGTSRGRSGAPALASTIASFSACAVALSLQFFDIRTWVLRGDLAALEDVVPTLSWVAMILTVVTIGLNVLAHAACRDSTRRTGRPWPPVA